MCITPLWRKTSFCSPIFRLYSFLPILIWDIILIKQILDFLIFPIGYKGINSICNTYFFSSNFS